VACLVLRSKAGASAWFALPEGALLLPLTGTPTESCEQDADAYALAAEAYMNLSPWDYYAADGSLKPNAQTAEQLLVKALQLHPEHTHALHLHIHVAEAGAPVPSPGLEHLSAARASGSAEQLAALNAQNGHLLHMPSHIFVRTGQYKRAVEVTRLPMNLTLPEGPTAFSHTCQSTTYTCWCTLPGQYSSDACCCWHCQQACCLFLRASIG